MTDINNVPFKSQYTYQDIDHLIETADLPKIPRDVETLAMLNEVESKLQKVNIPTVGNLNLPTPTSSGFSNNDQKAPNLTTKEGIENYLASQDKKNYTTKIDNPLVPYRHSSYQTNFERYYHHGKFSKIGFNPFLDNEQIYNENSTWFDDVGRASKMFKNLFWTGAVSSYRSLGDLFDEDSYLSGVDLESAREFADATRIGNSTRGGAAQFLTNLGLQFGYTAGIIGSIALEEFALTAMTGGGSVLSSPVRMGARIAKLSANSTKAGKITKGTIDLIKNLKDVNKYKGFRESVKLGDNFVTRFVMPETLEVLKTLSTAKNAGKNITNMTKISKTVGAGYRDLRSLNYALSEAKMESGMIYDQQFADNISRLQRDSLDGSLTPEQITKARNNANGAAFYGLASNAAIIHISNQFVLGTALSSHSRRLKKALQEPGGGVFSKINTKKPAIKDGVLQKDILELQKNGFAGLIDGIKPGSFKKGVKQTALFALRYSVANIAEGLQELGQEAIAEGAKEYYTSVFDDPSMGGINLYLSTLGSGMGKQLNGHGFETFMSGFMMGGPAKVMQTMLFKTAPNLTQKIFNREAYDKEIKTKKENEAALLELGQGFWNELASDSDVSLLQNIENLIVQKQISEDMSDAMMNDDLFEVHNLKDFSKLMNVYTLIKNNGLEYFRELINDTLQLNSRELAEAHPSSKSDVKNNKIKERLESYLEDINKIEENFENIDNRLINIFDESQYEEGTEEFENERAKRQTFDRYKMIALFTKDRVRRSSERMLSIYQEFESKELYKNMSASDIVVLLSPYKLAQEIEFLKSTIDSLDKTSDPDLYSRKEERLKDLSAINEFYNEKVLTEEEIQQNLFKRIATQKKYENIEDYLKSEDFKKDLEADAVLASAYKNRKKQKGRRTEIDWRKKKQLANLVKTYISNLAKVQNSSIDDTQLYEVIRKIFDYSQLQRENSIFTNASITLSNPEVISNFVDSYHKFHIDNNKKKVQSFKKSIEKLIEQKELASLLQQVADLKDPNNKTFGIYLEAERLDKYLKTKNPDFLVFSNAYGYITKDNNPELYRRIKAMVNNYVSLTKPTKKASGSEALDEELESYEFEFDEEEGVEGDEEYDFEEDVEGEEAYEGLEQSSVDEVEIDPENLPHLKELLKKFYNKGIEAGVTEEDFIGTDTGKKIVLIYTQLMTGENLGLYTYKQYYNKILKRQKVEFNSIAGFDKYLRFIKGNNEDGPKKSEQLIRDNDFLIDDFILTDAAEAAKKKKPSKLTTKYQGQEIQEKRISQDESEFIIKGVKDERFETLDDAKDYIDELVENNEHLGEFKMFGETMFYGKEIMIREKGKAVPYIVITGNDVKNKRKLFLLAKSRFDSEKDPVDLRRLKTGKKVLTKTQYDKIKVKTSKGKTTKANVNTKTGSVKVKKTEGPVVAVDNAINVYPKRQDKDKFKKIIQSLTEEQLASLKIKIKRNKGGGVVSNNNFDPSNSGKGNKNIKKKKEMFELAIIIPAELHEYINDLLGEDYYNEDNNVLGFIPGDFLQYLDVNGNEISPLDFDISDAQNLINLQKGDRAKNSLQRFIQNHILSTLVAEQADKLLSKNIEVLVSQEDLGIKINFHTGSLPTKSFQGKPRKIDTKKHNLDGHTVIVRRIAGELDVIKSAESNFLIEELSPQLHQKLLKTDAYVYLYRLPNGAISYMPIKSSLLTEGEKKDLYEDIGEIIIDTIKNNTKFDKKEQRNKQIKNSYNTKENERIKDTYFISSVQGYAFEINITATGTLIIKASKYNSKTNKYEPLLQNQYHNALERVIQKLDPDITTEEIFKPENIAGFVEMYVNEAVKSLTEETGAKVNIRKSFASNATVEEILEVSETTAIEFPFLYSNIKIQAANDTVRKKMVAQYQAYVTARQASSVKKATSKKGGTKKPKYPVLMQNLVSGEERYGTLQIAQDEVKKALGETPHSIDMIEMGFRTRTTRSVQKSKNLKPGDIIMHQGTSEDGTTKVFYAKITEIYEESDPMFDQTWELEGWTEEGLDNAKRFKTGARAILFELIDDPTTTNVKSKKPKVQSKEAISDIITAQLELGVELETILDTLNEQGYVIKNNNSTLVDLDSGRDAIIFNIDGVIVPMYRSSKGTSSKTKGRWYPFFYSTDNWVVKGLSKNYKNGYGNPIIKQIQDALNKNYKYEEAKSTVKANQDELYENIFGDLINLNQKKNDGAYDATNYFYAALMLKNWHEELGGVDIVGYKEYISGVLKSKRFKEVSKAIESYEENSRAVFSDVEKILESITPEKKVKKPKVKKTKPKVKKKKIEIKGTNEEVLKQLEKIAADYTSSLTGAESISTEDLRLSYNNVLDIIDSLSINYLKFKTRNKEARNNFGELQALRDEYSNLIKQRNVVDKILTEEELEESEITLQVFTNWVQDNLPDVFSVQELNTLKDKLRTDGVRVGAFLQYFNDISGRVEGTIYTGEKNIHKFHEAFHGVFRMLLTDSEQKALLEVSEIELRKKHGENFLSELEKFRNKSQKYKLLTRSELKKLFYEEHIADSFDNYTKDKLAPKPNNIFLRFFNWLIRKIKGLVNKSVNSDFKLYFERINSGYYKNATVADNAFTRSMENGNTLTANSIIRHAEYESSQGVITNEYLDPITANNIVNRITASVIYKMSNLESYIAKDKKGNIIRLDFQDIIDGSIIEMQDLYDSEKNTLLNNLDVESQKEIENILSSFLYYDKDLKKAVNEKLDVLQINEEGIENRMVEIEESGLIRNTENYDVDSDMIGGWKALPSQVRRYFNTVLIEDIDMFGNQLIIEYDSAGNPLTERNLLTQINTAEAYNGFIKAVANTVGQEAILKKLIKYGRNNKNTEAVVNRLLSDLNITSEEVFEPGFDINKIENKQIFLMITKAFENFRVPYYMIHMNKSNNKTYLYSTSKRDDAHAQIDRWASKHKSLYKKLSRSPQQKEITANILTLLKDVISGQRNLQTAKYVLLYDNEKSLIAIKEDNRKAINTIKKTYFSKSKAQEEDITDIFTVLSQLLNDYTGISLSPLYIEYSYVHNSVDFDFFTAEQEFLKESYEDVEPITLEDITQIMRIINTYGKNKKGYLFKGQIDGEITTEDTESRLTRLALGNAEFDETVGASTFINAEGELVYNHQLGTFLLKSLYGLNIKDSGTAEQIKQELIKKHPILEFNHLLNSPAFLKMMELGKIHGMRINGEKTSSISKDIDNLSEFAQTGEGTTYGSMTAQSFLVSLINAYAGLINKGNDQVETIEYVDENGDLIETAIAPILIRVLEAANTGEMVALPVIEGVEKLEDGKTEITQDTLDKLLLRLAGEFNRIQKESRSAPDSVTGKGDLAIGYNAKKTKKGKIVFDKNGRAFKFFSAGKVLDTQGAFKQRAIVEVVQKDSIIDALSKKKENDSSMVFFRSNSKQTLQLSLYGVPYEVSIKNDPKSKKQKNVLLTIKLMEKVKNSELYDDVERWDLFVNDVKEAGYLKGEKDSVSKIEVNLVSGTFYTDNATLANFLNYSGGIDDKVISIDRYKVLSKPEIEEVKKLKELENQDSEGSVINIKESLEKIARDNSNEMVNSLEDLKKVIEKNGIEYDSLRAFILHNVDAQFLNFYNVLQDFKLFNRISSDIKKEMTSFHSEDISGDPQVTENSVKSQELLHLISNDPYHNLYQIFMNDYVNTMGINDVLLGDQSLTLKDAVDMVKRAKGANAAIISVANELIDKDRGINFPVREVELLAITDPIRTSKISKKEIEQADGEFYITLKTHKYLQNSLGRYSETQRAAVEKMLRGEAVPYEDIYGMLDSSGRFTKGLAKLNEMLNPKKFVYYDGVTYAKMSVVVLTRELASERNDKGEWQAKVGFEKQHNLLNKMESIEYNADGSETNRLGAAAPISALKMLKMNVQAIEEMASAGKLKGDPWMKLNANFFGLQVENPSNKTEIPDPTQIKNLILHELPNDIAIKTWVKIDGVSYNLLELKNKYNKNKRDGLNQIYVGHRNLLFELSPDTSFNEIQESKESGKLTPKLKVFVDYAIESLKSSGSNSNILPYFEQMSNGTKYDLNNTIVEKKFIQLFLTFWTNNVFKEKLNGDQLTLMADFGVPIFRLVYSVDKNGYPDKQVTLRYEEFKELNQKLDLRIDEGEFADQDEAITSKLKRLLKEKKGDNKKKNISIPVLILDRLRHDMNEYKIDGDPSNLDNWEDQKTKYSEIIVPPRSLEEAINLYKKLTEEEIFEKYQLWLTEERYSAFEDKFTSWQKERLKRKKIKKPSYKDEFLVRMFANQYGYEYNISGKKIRFSEKAGKTLSIPEVLAKIFSVRIPSQEKHSAQNSKRVDYLPPIYGSTAIMASEMVEITGWDFDVDKIFSQFKEFFFKNGEFVEFKKFEVKDSKGNIVVNYEKEYKQYVEWVNKELNNKKSSINKAKKLFDSDQDAIKYEIKFLDEVIPWALTDKEIHDLKKQGLYKSSINALSIIGLPRTLEEYKMYRDYKGNVPYKSALENENLDAKYAVLGSERFTGTRTLYEDKTGSKSFSKKGKVIDDNVRPIAYEPADLQPLFDLFEELEALIPEWTKGRKEGDIDVDNLLGKFKSFFNNKLGSKNIGAIVLPNVYLSLMSQVGMTVNASSGKVLKMNGQVYDTFGEEYEKKNSDDKKIPNRTQYIISALITAMTDNAKERMAAKFGLNKSALSVVGTMTSLGVPLKTSILLANNEIIQHLYYLNETEEKFDFKGSISAIAETLKAYLISKSPKATINKQNILGRRTLNDEELVQSLRERVIDPLIDFVGVDFSKPKAFASQLKDKFTDEEFLQVKEQLIFEVAILEEYLKANAIQEYTRNVGTIVQLQSGVGNSVEDILRYNKAIKELSLNLTKKEFQKLYARGVEKKESNIIVDSRLLFKPEDFSTASFHAMYFKMYEDFTTNILPNVALQFTAPFENITNVIFENLSPYLKEADKVKVMEDLSSYLSIQAYINYAEKHPDNTLKQNLATLTNDIKYSDENNIINIIDQLKNVESLRNNFFLNHFIIEEDKMDPDNLTGMFMAVSNTFARMDDVQKLSLQSSLVELMTSNETVDQDNLLRVKDLASGIIHYVMAKDGLRLKYKGLSSALSPVAIEPYLLSIKGMMKEMTNPTHVGIQNIFGLTFNELINDFANGYLIGYKTAANLLSKSFFADENTLGSAKTQNIRTTDAPVKAILKNNPNNVVIAFKKQQVLQSVSFQHWDQKALKFYRSYAKSQGLGVVKKGKPTHVALITASKEQTKKDKKIIKDYEAKGVKVLFVKNLSELEQFISKENIKKLHIEISGRIGFNYLKNILTPILSTDKELKSKETKVVVEGENIHYEGSDFAQNLTNPGNNLKVTLNVKGKGNVTFRNAEHAYQTLKSGKFDVVAYNSKDFKPVGSKPVNKKKSYKIMVDILTSKLKQHPKLVDGIIEKGGLEYLKKSKHEVTGDAYWESSGQNKFMQALKEAFVAVAPEQKKEKSGTKQQVFYIDTQFTFLKEGKKISISDDYVNFQQFIQSQIDTIKETLEKERAYNSSVSLKDSKLQIRFKTNSLSQSQRNFLNIEDDGYRLMDAIGDVFKEEFGYNPVTHKKLGKIKPGSSTGVYLESTEDGVLRLIVNPLGITPNKLDFEYFSHIPKAKGSQDKITERINQTKSKGFTPVISEVLRNGKKEFITQFKLPLYKLVVLTKKDENNQPFKEYKYFKLKLEKNTNLGAKPAVKSYFSNKRNDTRSINQDNPFVEGYYAEYEEVSSMGSAADTAIAFMFSGLPTTSEIKDFVNSRFGIESESDLFAFEEIDDLENIDDLDFYYEEDEAGFEELEEGDDKSQEAMNTLLQKTNDDKTLDEFRNDDTVMFGISMFSDAIREILGLQGNQQITKNTLPKYIKKYAKDYEVTIDEVIEEINCIIK